MWLGCRKKIFSWESVRDFFAASRISELKKEGHICALFHPLILKCTLTVFPNASDKQLILLAIVDYNVYVCFQGG